MVATGRIHAAVRALGMPTAVALALALGIFWPAGAPAALADPCGLAFNTATTIASDTTWTVADSPVCVNAVVSVWRQAKLTVDARVVAKFGTAAQLQVYGTLSATGAGDNKVYFTSIRDDSVGGDTNGDGGATTPARGDWRGLYLGNYLGNSGIGDLEYVEVRYGGGNGSAGIYVDGSLDQGTSGFTLTNSVVRDSSTQGLFMTQNRPTYRIENNTFTDNAGYAVYLTSSFIPSSLGGGNGGTGNGTNGFVLANMPWIAPGGSTLRAQALPYVLGTSLGVGGSLTLDPGVVIKGFGDTYLRVGSSGTLIAKGTSGNKVYFTSIKDDTAGGDTNGDGAATSPAKGDWWGLSLSEGSIADVDYVDIRYGGSNVIPADLWAYGSKALTVTNSIIRDSWDQGIRIEPSFTGNAGPANITGNQVLNNGGVGLYVKTSLPVAITNSLFARNQGWGLEAQGNSVTIHSIDVVSNSSGLYLYNAGDSTVRNTLVVSNTGNGVQVSGTAPTFENNDVWGNGTNYSGMGGQTGLNGNISADPLFVNFAGGDYHIQTSSPAIDAGTATGAPVTDIDGESRPQDVGFDMGFDERPSSADLSLSKTDSPDPVRAGGLLTYTLTLANNGPMAATNTVVTDSVPVSTTFRSMAAEAGWTCATPSVGGTGNAVCANPSLAVGATALFTMVVRVDPGTPSATAINNQATASSDRADPVPANNTAAAVTGVNRSADLSVSVADGPDPVVMGQTLTYTVTVTNNGPSIAMNILVTDTLPAGATFGSATPSQGTCSQAGGIVTCSLGFLLDGASATVTINATPAVGGSITDSATVSATEPDDNPADNTATATTTVVAADLAVTKTDSPDPVVAGANVTYIMNLTNNGPSAAGNVSLSDTVPASTTFRSLSAAGGWTCDTPAVGGTGTVNCTNPSLAAGATARFTMTVQVNSWTPSGAAISNQVSVSSDTPDPSSGNNSATATTAVVRSADLSLSKTDSPDPVNLGQSLTYVATLANNGPSDAGNVSLYDTLPAGVAFGSATPSQGSCTRLGNSVNCSLGSLAAGASATVNIVVTPTVGGSISNYANAWPGESDPNSSNNYATATTTVIAADLSVTKTGSPDPVTAGTDLSYTITISNTGPSAAVNAALNDAVPANATFQSLAAPAGWACTTPAVGETGAVSCSNPSLASGASGVFTLVVRVSAGVPNGTTIANQASVSSDTPDPATGNNTATATSTVGTAADVAIAKIDSPDPVQLGQNLTYQVTVTNNGPSNATGVSVTDNLPAGVSFLSATPSQGSCSQAGGTVSCSIGALASGASATVSIVVTPTAGGTVTNYASVSATEIDPNPANNAAQSTTTVIAADLSLTKADSPDPVTAGTSLTYNITVANGGPSAAANVSLLDAVPANTTFQSLAAAAGWTCATPTVGGTGPATCTSPSLAAWAAASFTMTVLVNSGAPSGSIIANQAAVYSDTPDPNSGNNSATASTLVVRSADLAVTKADGPDPMLLGQSLYYTITVSNSGPSDVSNIGLNDSLPSGVVFGSATPSQGTCTQTAGTVNCSLGSLVAGTSASVNILVTPTAGGSITNSAGASASESDPNPANNTAAATTTVIAADLSVTKADSPEPVTAGANLTYTITAGNNGPNAAVNVAVNDPLPANTTFQSLAAPAGWTCNALSVGGTGTVSCTNPSLASGASGVFTLVVRVNPDTLPESPFADTTTITNTVSVSSDTPDPVSGNNTASAITTVNRSADLALSKADGPDPVTLGQTLTYTLTVTNSGPSDAFAVVMQDTLPAGVSFVSASASQGTCTAGTGVVTCFIGTIPVGASATATIVVTPNTGGVLTNSASVNGNQSDPNTANNSATETTTVVSREEADLAVTKTDSPDPVAPGGALVYTVMLKNNGPASATNVTLTDAVPAGTTLLWFSSNPGLTCTRPSRGGTGNVVCTTPSLAAGAALAFRLTVTVNPSAPGGSTITNQATASSDTPDPNPSNNSATATTTIASADLAVTKTDSPDPVAPGGLLTYTVAVRNNGPMAAANVTLTDTVPAGTTFQGLTASAAWSCTTPVPGGTGNVVCATANVPAGTGRAFKFWVQVNAGTPHMTVITNQATGSSTTPDPNPADNTATATTRVR